MTLTVNKKTYEAGELVAYVEKLEKENANLKVLGKYELNIAKLEIEKLEKENAEFEAQIEKMKCCLKCEHWYYYKSFCDKDNSYHSEGQSCEHFTLRR